MLPLPNGCSCSKISVHPKNWKSGNPSLQQDWYIHYRFYDPAMDRPKQVIIKGMNSFKDLTSRRSATQTLLDHETDLLINQGYNPFTGACISTVYTDREIDPNTPFIRALQRAREMMNRSKSTKTDLKSVIKGVEKAALRIGITSIPISKISRKHFKQIFIECESAVPGWSAIRFNKYRSYLKMLFNELIEFEATHIDPLAGIKKQKTLKKIRTVLSSDQRKLIDTHLRKKHYNFWRFMQIFFHSGARESELLQVKKSHIDLPGQRYMITMKKGVQYIEVWKVIKDVALPFWSEIYTDAADDQYLFSKDLRPGEKPIRPDQITRRWRTHVKEGLGIAADFYSLKHLNLDETSAALSVQDASRMAGHSTPVVTMAHYLVGEKERQDERLKKVNNPFS